MIRIAAALLISTLWISGSTQSIELTGKVSNTKGTPIAGATLSLALQKNVSATTDSKGAFTLTAVGVNAPVPLLPNSDVIAINNNVITVSLTKSAPVKIDLFDMRGNLLEKISEHASAAGTYSFNLATHRFATSMMVVRVAAGGTTSTFQYLPFRNGNRLISAPVGAASSTGRLAKIQATVDTLRVFAAGYTPKNVPISSYTTPVNVTLDTMSLAKFSFFITSLAAIQALAKSEDGFGGDLRFGKTGQGAGLLGADSICQCIAERSMKGSGVKQWRAFLSATKGSDGKQVNAIDRVGNGPWYDRLGRVVALTKADLAHPRPLNIDDEIKNDLPNEDGVPNHRPDPTKPQVDNHLTVTGSDTSGKLFPGSNSGMGGGGGGLVATCQDWTSKEAKGGQPRAGLAWPRAGFGGFGKATVTAFGAIDNNNWISSWSLPGCLPGIELEEKGAPLPGEEFIGAGGGYGGFYCFALTP